MFVVNCIVTAISEGLVTQALNTNFIVFYLPIRCVTVQPVLLSFTGCLKYCILSVESIFAVGFIGAVVPNAHDGNATDVKTLV